MKISAFEEFCAKNDIKFKIDEPMRNHTSFKIGGPADYFVTVDTKEALCCLVSKLSELKIPYFILGKGSNLLVSDKGIEGVVISLVGMSKVDVDGDYIVADAGASLAAVCVTAQQNSLKGLEFAYGIPGTIGGALYMNAGAYGGEMSQVVEKAEYMTESGELKTITLNEMLLGYRTSIFKKGSMIITRVFLKLAKGSSADICQNMDDFMSRRRQKQPLEYPSAGSTFKRPEGHFAGALIEKNALKGATVGGAQVSEKHAGFIINYKNATSEDVRKLIDYVADTVYKADKIRLEPEVIFVGRE